MLQKSHLLALADEYERVESVEDKTLSFRLFRDSKKLSALRGEGDITTARFNLALEWFAANWPEHAQWPKGIARPRIAA